MIMNKLKEKHEDKYTIEQIRVWGNMIQKKNTESYEDPPDKPFFLANQERKH